MAKGVWDLLKSTLGMDGSGQGAPVLSRFSESLPVNRISKMFAPLGKERSGLPAQVTRYIEKGDNTSLLLDLQSNAVQTGWRSRVRHYSPRDELQLFTNLGAWRVDQMMRFGEVLAALEPITYEWGYFGTKASPDWLRHVVTIWLGHDRKNQPVDTLRALCDHAGIGLGPVVDMVFCRDATTYGARNSVSRFDGVSELLVSEQEGVNAAFANAGADVRATLAGAIGRFKLHANYLPLLLDAATGTAKKVRAAARASLTGADSAALAALIEETFTKAPPAKRAMLVEVAAESLGPASPALMAKLREGESNARVLSAFDMTAGATAPIEKKTVNPFAAAANADGASGYTAVDGTRVELPPLEPLPTPERMDRAALKLLEPALDEFNRKIAEGKKQAANNWHWSRSYGTLGQRDLDALARLAEGSGVVGKNSNAFQWLRFPMFRHPALDQFFDDSRVSLRHLVRIGAVCANGNFHALLNDWSGPAGIAIQRRLAAGADIRQVAALWNDCGGDNFITEHLTRRWYWKLPDLGVEVWPLLLPHFRHIDEALGLIPQSGTEPMRVQAGIDLIENLPKLPERYRARMLLLANDTSMHIRDRARELLRDTPGLGGAIALQLQDGRQTVRAQAADWLARRGERGEAPALRAALKKDKSDVARAAMISALERMGEDVSEYFDRKAMVKEATAGIAKLKIKALDWFPFDRLPALHWADGTPLDPVLPRWWVMLAGKLKQPGGNALIDLWLDRLAPGDAAKLGWMVLTIWIDQDTRSPTDEECNAYANATVDNLLQQHIDWARRWPQHAEYYPTDRAVLFARLKLQKAKEYYGSAADSKGILALTSKVNGADAAQRVRAFIKDHGARASQAKALLDCLATNGSSAALQVVLATSNRAKQKSVQAHAAALIAEIADRNGWTTAELADRTVPTGGFDADGTLELDCGEERIYTGRLDAVDAVALFNADGREVKALPGPRADEERPTVEAAKKLLSNAKKEVKQVLAAQGERLRESMCLERAWPRDDWQSFIAGHPLVGRIAARLVWQGLDDDGAAGVLFRPLGDGSYTDAEDGDIDIAGFASIRLVHSTQMDAETIAAWRQHLADYEVSPPFDQLGRDLPKLAPEQLKAQTITDREGWMIETFKLRGSAGKRGWQRGPAQDGGWFMTYEKRFGEAGLMAEIEFTGSPLPEQNQQGALQSLCFRKLAQGARGGSQVMLADVPPVLLAECWQDFHDIADKGTGFDPEWQKKAYG